jgi:hypothetical protein
MSSDSPSEFIDSVTGPDKWYLKASALIRSAKAVMLDLEEDDAWEAITVVSETARALSSDSESDPSKEAISRAFQNRAQIETATLLFGLALENALKGKLIGEQPEDVRVSVTLDGNNNPVDARFREIGGSQIDHDLTSLANGAGVFGHTDLVPEEYTHEELTKILDFLGHIVRWGGRYPEPLKYEDREELSETTDPFSGAASFSGKDRIAFEGMAVSLKLITDLVPDDILRMHGVSPQQNVYSPSGDQDGAPAE